MILVLVPPASIDGMPAVSSRVSLFRRPQSHKAGLELLCSRRVPRRGLLMSVFSELWSGYEQKDFEELTIWT